MILQCCFCCQVPAGLLLVALQNVASGLPLLPVHGSSRPLCCFSFLVLLGPSQTPLSPPTLVGEAGLSWNWPWSSLLITSLSKTLAFFHSIPILWVVPLLIHCSAARSLGAWLSPASPSHVNDTTRVRRMDTILDCFTYQLCALGYLLALCLNIVWKTIRTLHSDRVIARSKGGNFWGGIK